MGEPDRFRILTLCGGGVRGLFQARLLERLEERTGLATREHFDLIGATSTGALVGGALAAGVRARDVRLAFERHGPQIFRPRPLGLIRQGPRYNTRLLETAVREMVGDTTFEDLSVRLLVTASTADTFKGKLFSNSSDGKAHVADAVLASTAAPTYFRSHTSGQDRRSYLDGGLWANDPTAATLGYAREELQISDSHLRIVTLGTGRRAAGANTAKLNKMRPASFDSLRLVYEMLFGLQEWTVHHAVSRYVSHSNYCVINPHLPEWIPLDDWPASSRLMPALADEEYERQANRINAILTSPGPAQTASPGPTADPIAVEGIAAGGVTRFTPSRKYYARFRAGRESITTYCETATRTLTFVSINLMTGDALESILETFEGMLKRNESPVSIKLSILDPSRDYLVESVAGNLRMTGDELSTSINRLIQHVKEWHGDLPENVKPYFRFHTHRTIPSASAIMIDEQEAFGTIQLETKAYKSPAIEAFGFEVAHGSELFASLQKAYNQLIADGDLII